MKKAFLIVSALCVMLSGLTGCGKKAPEGYKATKNGLFYKFYVCDKDAALPEVGYVIDLTLACSINDTNVIIPPAKNIIQLEEPSFTTDFMEGIAMMHIGDSASFIVNIDSTFVNVFRTPELPEEFNSTDVMRFDIKINDFYPQSEYKFKMIEAVKQHYPEETARAKEELDAYFAEHNIDAKPTATGLYYVMTQEGNGEMPEVGSNVKVHYTGKLIDGTVFDSSIERGEPIEFPLGMGRVISGWDEGIMLMSKGEKGVLYIPYYLGYGDRGAGGVIPPFATLIFDVELVDF